MKPNPAVVYVVVLTLAATVMVGMWMTYSLVVQKADAALIAIISGFSGTALGGLLSILNRTSSTPDAPSETKIVNTDKEPVPTKEK